MESTALWGIEPILLFQFSFQLGQESRRQRKTESLRRLHFDPHHAFRIEITGLLLLERLENLAMLAVHLHLEIGAPDGERVWTVSAPAASSGGV